jgi:anti-anti-sigma factor
MQLAAHHAFIVVCCHVETPGMVHISYIDEMRPAFFRKYALQASFTNTILIVSNSSSFISNVINLFLYVSRTYKNLLTFKNYLQYDQIRLYLEKSMIEVTEKNNGIFVVKIVMKEVHTLDVPDLKEKLQQTIIDKGIKKMVVDLADVKMITSSGIGIFLNINQGLKSQLRLASANEEVKKVLDLTKVTSVIKLYKSVDEALASF